jgi:hypothetical protein
VIEPEQRGARHRGQVEHARDGAGRGRREPAADLAEQQRVTGLKYAAAEHHGDAGRRQAQSPHRGDRHQLHFLRLPAHQGPCHLVTARGHREQHRAERDQVGLTEFALVHGHGHVAHRGQAEARGHRGAERRGRPAAVPAAHGVPHHRVAEPEAAAPVTGQRAVGQVPGRRAVRRHRHAVDPGAAGDRHAPGLLGAAAEHRERVVQRDRGARPAGRGERGGQRRLLLRQVGPGQARGDMRGERARPAGAGAVHACLRRRLGDHVAESAHGAVDAVVLVRRAGAAHGGEQGTVPADEGQVRLAVAAVDGEHGGEPALLSLVRHAGRVKPTSGTAGFPR